MNESIQPITVDSKEERYQLMLQQVACVVEGEMDVVANMANVCALMKDTFGWLWIGFYRVDTSANQLVLGPFQGPLACTRINYGKGVCGEVWQTAATQVVDDVNQHPNHIACSSLSKSEVVVPLIDSEGNVIAVLDIDASEVGVFNQTDAYYLEKVAQLLMSK